MMAVLRIEERRARLFGIDRREAPVKASLSNKEMRDLSERMEGIAVHGKKLPTGVLFHFSKAVDTEIGGMAWWAGYHQAMSGDAGFDTAGLTGAQIEAKAIAHADMVLRSLQSPFADRENSDMMSLRERRISE